MEASERDGAPGNDATTGAAGSPPDPATPPSPTPDLLHRGDAISDAILDHAADGIVTIDARGRIRSWNRAAEELFGYPAEEIVGESLQLLMPEAQLQHHDHFVQAYVRGDKERRFVGTRREEQARRRDGTTVPVEILVSEVRVDGEHLFVGIVRDLAPIKEAEARAAALQRELVEVSRQAGKAEVATSILHNLGNELTSLSVSAQTLAEQVEQRTGARLDRLVELLAAQDDLGAFLSEDPRGQQLPDFLLALAEQRRQDRDRMRKRIDAMLDSVRHIRRVVAMQEDHAQLGTAEITVRPAALADEALAMAEDDLATGSIQVERAYEALPPLPLDRSRILHILVHLIQNARDTLQAVTERPRRIRVEVARADGAVRFRIIDNGQGIPGEELSRVFQAGFTTKEFGSGYGLHSSALAARELGGSLTATSEGPGRGATFTLRLPGSEA